MKALEKVSFVMKGGHIVKTPGGGETLAGQLSHSRAGNLDARPRREVHFAQEVSETDDERERRAREQDKAEAAAEARVQHRLEEERRDDRAEQ